MAAMSASDQGGKDTRGRRIRAITLLATLGLLLAACDAGGSSSASASPTPFASQATATIPGASGPTPTTVPGSVAQAGSIDICNPNQAPLIAASVPAEVPQYTNGQLRLAQPVGSGNLEIGYCTTDSVSVVGAFYVQALPGKGWQNIQTFHNLSTQNIIATRGSSETLTITASPDTLVSGDTNLLIIVKGL